MFRRFWMLMCVLGLAWAQVITPVYADTTYTVQPGDNLTRIATRFNTTVEALMQANNITNPNSIQVGQVLNIPGGEGSPASPAAPTGQIIYIVKPGDSIYRIASRFKISAEELIRVNNLQSTTLQIGQQLIIPGVAPAAPANTEPIYARIEGSAAFKQRLTEALDWVKARDAEAFNRMNVYITRITPSPYSNLAQAIPLEGGCWVRALARNNMSVPMIAALLYHEATHCVQFSQGLPNQRAAEIDAYTAQLDFMRRNGFSAAEIAYYEKVLAYYQNSPDDGRYVPPPNF